MYKFYTSGGGGGEGGGGWSTPLSKPYKYVLPPNGTVFEPFWSVIGSYNHFDLKLSMFTC